MRVFILALLLALSAFFSPPGIWSLSMSVISGLLVSGAFYMNLGSHGAKEMNERGKSKLSRLQLTIGGAAGLLSLIMVARSVGRLVF